MFRYCGIAFGALCASLIIFPLSSQAALIITVGDATIAEGGTAFVDVRIQSDNDDALQAFGFEFRISAGASRLEFVAPQPDSQLTDSRYVFFDNSFRETSGLPVGAVSGFTMDTYIGSDFTEDGADVPVIASRDLLVRLQITANTDLAPIAGDEFTISLIPDSNGDGAPFDFFGGDSTFFIDTSFVDVPVDSANSDFSGLVTVTSAGAVPEPSSLLLLSGLGSLALLHCRRQRNKPLR